VKRRLDQALVDRGLVRSRNQGREFILNGEVLLEGSPCLQPSQLVSEDAGIEIAESASLHRVGRGYDKLGSFLDLHPIDFTGRFVVDGGASTGGFTQQALERGAASVLAVEIGKGQLAPGLLEHPRVLSRENCDLLSITRLDTDCQILMLDLSFVSLLTILPALKLPLAPDACLVALVKPQFELPRREFTAGGRFRRPNAWQKVLHSILDCARHQGWTILAEEPVEPGPDQRHREFMFSALRGETGAV
jgi:23S rRNA (cytidine1920-2'-O)/16S rRNA (cytidine1409-2'-O)-methyltransferase